MKLIQNVSKGVKFLYVKNEYTFIFTLLVITLSKVHPDISKIGNDSVIAFKGYISIHLSVIFRFSMLKSIRM